jgi:L,D-transpeptidase catalytic domain
MFQAVKRVVNRRDLLRQGLTAGAFLALPGRALAQAADPLTSEFDRAFGGPAAPAPVEAAPPAPVHDPAYQRRLAEVAMRERDRAGAKLWRTDIVGIADFGRSSSLPRLHFVNMESGLIRSFLVAHGRGSDPQHDGWLKSFSNTPGSEATSRGAYLTCEWYKGKYGTSIRLEGMDADNHNALSRAIVMHPAAYVDPGMAAHWGKIGRSEGCFAMSQADFNEALWHLSGGRLLYADRIV